MEQRTQKLIHTSTPADFDNSVRAIEWGKSFQQMVLKQLDKQAKN